MAKPTSIKAVLLRPLADGRCTVYIRISKDYKTHYIATEVAVLKKYWNKKASVDVPTWIAKAHPLSGPYNDIILNKLVELSPYRSDRQLSSVQIKQKIVRPVERDTINEFWGELIHEFEKNGKFAMRDKHQAERNKFSGFRAEVLFRELNYELTTKYYQHLLTINKPSTAGKSMEFLQQIVREAMKREKMTKNPFDHFEIKRVKTNSNAKKAVLTTEELQRFASLELVPNSPICIARDFFLIQIYCSGARVGEILSLRNSDISNEYVNYHLEKKKDGNAKVKRVFVTPVLQKLFDTYKKEGNVFLMPYLKGIDENNPERVMKQIQSKTTIINKYLKQLSAQANIGKEISTHTARHMVGQILENLGIDLKEIKNSIGHENESQTKTYIKNDKPILVEETAKLIYNELRIS